MSLTELSKKFDTKEKCIAHLEKVKWGNTPTCNFCGSTNVRRRSTNYLQWHCNKCNRDTSVLVNSIFEDSRMPLPKWFQLIYLMLNAKKGISAKQISRDIGVTYKTAWYSAMRVRCAMLDWGEQLEGIVEMDETYIGGKPRKRNNAAPADNVPTIGNLYDRKDNIFKRGRGTKKIPIAGIVERKGRVVAKLMDRLTSEELIKLLKKAVKTNESTLMTDDFRAYQKMDELIERFVINHSSKQYVQGAIHTNTIEGFWSIIKNGIRGQYHVLSKKYLPFYLAEFCYRYNRRELTPSESFKETIDNAIDNNKCFVNAKPKDDVKKIVYPKKDRKKAVRPKKTKKR